MLSLLEIEKQYPENLRPFKRFILREYLQYKLLEIIFESPFSDKLCFLGGTCLRLVHGQQRFSEDLDFDNFNLSDHEFSEISILLKKELNKQGYEIEFKNVFKGAFHCYIRFPKLLFNEGLSGHQEEKILIQLDTEPQHFNFTPEKFILNKFDVFTSINVTPLDVLLAQKFYAVINRKRNKGRDFFDIVFLLGMNVVPNYDYLTMKLNISNGEQLKDAILNVCNQINMKEMADDVAPFIFHPKEVKQILYFEDYMRQVKL